MADSRLITLAIHTYEHASRLKQLLEGEGVNVVLQNVNLSEPVISSGVRVRIKERDLPLALRIVENTDIFSSASQRTRRQVLLPIDFNRHSTHAVDMAFHFARRCGADVILLHAFVDPEAADTRSQFSISLTIESGPSDISASLEKAADRQMARFSKRLRDRIKHGELPPVKFTTRVVEGVAEEVIVDTAKEISPELIVMSTRGAAIKEQELIGSVTAEVLDSCRYPIFTLPDNARQPSQPAEVSHVVMLCNLDQEDMLAVDALSHYFSEESLRVTLLAVPTRKQSTVVDSSVMLDYCQRHYPHYQFEVAALSPQSPIDDFMALGRKQPIDLLAVPNKKKSIFARLFNPSLAHKMIFHSDIPMIVIPV